MGRRRRLGMVAAGMAVAASLQLAPTALADHIKPGYNPGQVNPDVTQRWASPSPDNRHWQSAARCTGGEQAGTRNLLQFLNYHWGRGENWGIYNCRLPSLHSEGRAVDFHLDVSDPTDKAAGDSISAFFRRSDSGGARWAMARRFGIQEIIWNCRIWTAARAPEGWRLYSVCDPNSSSYSSSRTAQHKDHVHIGQNWQGANRATTAWTGYHYCYQCPTAQLAVGAVGVLGDPGISEEMIDPAADAETDVLNETVTGDPVE